MTGVVVLLDVVGRAVLVLAVAPQRLAVGDAGGFGVGVGVTAVGGIDLELVGPTLVVVLLGLWLAFAVRHRDAAPSVGTSAR